MANCILLKVKSQHKRDPGVGKAISKYKVNEDNRNTTAMPPSGETLLYSCSI